MSRKSIHRAATEAAAAAGPKDYTPENYFKAGDAVTISGCTRP